MFTSMNQPPAPTAEPSRRADAASTRGKLVIKRNEPEPKALTLFWSLYLLVAAGTTIFAVNHLWIYDANDFRLSSKVMLAMVGLGIGALWPMVRLSQVAPNKTAESVFADAVALCVPAQAVLWPLTLLGGWSWGVTSAIALAIIAWTLAIGGIVALGIGFRTTVGRSAWMIVAMAALLGAPLWALNAGWTTEHHLLVDWRLCSPLTMGWGMTGTLFGGAARLTPDKWNGVLVPGAAAAILWAIFAMSAGIRRSIATGDRSG